MTTPVEPLTHAHQFLLNALSVELGILMAAFVIWFVTDVVFTEDPCSDKDTTTVCS